MPVDLFAEYNRWTVTSGGTTGPVAGTSETWTVTSSVGAPAASNSANPPTQFRVVDAADTNVPPEIMIVTNVAGTTWTATRGAESGLPWAHAAGWTAIPVLSARVIPQITGIQTQIILSTQTVTAPSWAVYAEFMLVGGGAGGSGGGSALTSGGVTTQAGGIGGSCGGVVQTILPVTAGANYTVTIGAGGGGGAGGAVNGNIGAGGNSSAATTVVGTGVNLSTGFTPGGGSTPANTANTSASDISGVTGSSLSTDHTPVNWGIPGRGLKGNISQYPTGVMHPGLIGGGGGAPASATLGGIGAGAAQSFPVTFGPGNAGNSPADANGAAGQAAAANTGCGGGGGGGGAPGGTGGNGGAGGSGRVHITWRAA